MDKIDRNNPFISLNNIKDAINKYKNNTKINKKYTIEQSKEIFKFIAQQNFLYIKSEYNIIEDTYDDIKKEYSKLCNEHDNKIINYKKIEILYFETKNIYTEIIESHKKIIRLHADLLKIYENININNKIQRIDDDYEIFNKINNLYDKQIDEITQSSVNIKKMTEYKTDLYNKLHIIQTIYDESKIIISKFDI
jgi:hypothetical protein